LGWPSASVPLFVAAMGSGLALFRIAPPDHPQATFWREPMAATDDA